MVNTSVVYNQYSNWRNKYAQTDEKTEQKHMIKLQWKYTYTHSAKTKTETLQNDDKGNAHINSLIKIKIHLLSKYLLDT